MRTLAIDIETYSSENLADVGVYKYVDCQDFEILLFAYAFDDEDVKIVDLTCEQLPREVCDALFDSEILKTAYNANFERTCIQKHFNIKLPYESWLCSMVWGMELGLPAVLDRVAKILDLDVQKDARGKNLIKYFSCPCKPTKANGGRTRNLQQHGIEKWGIYREYCIKDVEVERKLRNKLAKLEMENSEKLLWLLDQKINDRGIKVDLKLIQKAIYLDNHFKEDCINKLKNITGLENPNSISQLKTWINSKLGYEVNSLDKGAVSELLSTVQDEEILNVLKLRVAIGKTSVTKYEAMQRSVCSDGRVRGVLQFYGAYRTGRWAGRIIQVQNLPQNHLEDINYTREFIKNESYENIVAKYPNLPQVLSELIRTAIIPDEGNKFIVSDFSAIEARVVAYLAGENWRLEVFKTHGKIYEASASKMFNIPIEKITKGSELRQKGKIAELALGYGGGKGALLSMGALKMGLSEDELPDLVSAWRNSNTAITRFWKEYEKAAIKAIELGEQTLVNGKILIGRSRKHLWVKLPYGRKIMYYLPQIAENQFGSKCIKYMHLNQTTKQWDRVETFGGKLVENIVQAFARDCLAYSLVKLEVLGFKTVFHVHDEAVIEVGKDEVFAEEIAAIMGQEIPWAKGLPLSADAYECDFYMKD